MSDTPEGNVPTRVILMNRSRGPITIDLKAHGELPAEQLRLSPRKKSRPILVARIGDLPPGVLKQALT